MPSIALARPMTAEDVARLESVQTIAISPDGSRIAYTTRSLPDVTSGEEDGKARQRLNLTTGPDAARAFLPDDMGVSSVSFSPDGSMITFLWSDEGEKTALWGIPVDGGSHRKLAAIEDAAIRKYAWAPDGSTVYMLTGAAPDEARDAEKEAGFDAVVYEEEQRFNRLFAAEVNRKRPDKNPREITVPGYVSDIEVAPDGNWAAITSAPSPLIDDAYTSKRLQILDLASGNIRRVIETPGKLGDFEISPDGTQISMIAAVDANDPAATTLHLVNVANGTYRALNAGAPEATVDTEWMADGRLATIAHVGAQSRLRIYTEDGNLVEDIASGPIILTGLESGGNRIAVEADSPRHPSELFLWSNGRFQRWTQHNEWLADVDFVEQRTMRYTARDGQQIEGILIEPVGGVPAGGAPTIMDVHGGPESHESNGWLTAYSMPGQVAAGEGYAVFLPNYRGSTGYGTAFSKQHQNNYTDPEFTDIVDAKRALVEAGITDPDRTGITGGSYGGYATAWSATALSDEYAAGVMFVGISNQVSKFGTTDIPNEMYLVHARKWPWEDWQGMMEVSPIYHVDTAETPLLIMHGEDDPRVSPTQSYELYRNIKLRKPDTPVRLVLYPDEGHGNAGAAARYDYNLRMMRWFDTYLKSGDRTAALPDPRPDLPDMESDAD
ncbi:prolyl oligopeptidase family serine peptidase [Altererythrobacter endophyticus]|uniref:Prolyl oligopeptidase family serine peptidase n=2 Tax=Altericroceibacterium endophyticum TaxID=1808508 RepID=A0A6I4TAE9_9SPHN|nr:prolyl oligopeptidase family serine peptidase [Altericroceibacterium endophyticum]